MYFWVRIKTTHSTMSFAKDIIASNVPKATEPAIAASAVPANTDAANNEGSGEGEGSNAAKIVENAATPQPAPSVTPAAAEPKPVAPTQDKAEGAKPAETPAKPAGEPLLGTKPDPAKIIADLKALGINVDNLEQLRPTPKVITPEEQKQNEEETREKAIQYGLKNKLFKSADLEQYTLDSKREVRDVALEQFTAQYKAANPEAEDYEIESAFSDYYAEEEDDDNYRKKVMATEMKKVAANVLAEKYPGITNINEDYGEVVKMETAARDYSQVVNNIFSTLPSDLKFNVEGREYTHVFKADSINSVKEQFLSTPSFLAFGQEAVNEGDLKSAVLDTLSTKEMRRAVETIAKAHSDATLLDKEAGRKGIQPDRASAAGSNEFGKTSTYQGFAKEQIENAKN